MMKSAYLYERVSTDEQADRGYSLRSQDETLKRWCEINNVLIKQIFIEDHSAKTFNRPEFQKLLINLRKHKGIVDLVLFTKWDRFSRNAGDAYGMINLLNKLGVEPQGVEQPLDLSIPENKMMLAFYLAAPEVENDRRALNVFSGMRRAQKEGRWMGTAPIGYKNRILENGKKCIDPDPLTGPFIKWLFQELATGKFTAESLFKRGKELFDISCSKNNFWNALRNPVYCGKIKIKAFKSEEETMVTGQHEPLISESLFYDVQDILDGRKKTQRTKVTVDDRFPLRGFILCPECGRLLTASSSKGRKGYYHYYHCISSCGVRYKSEVAEDAFKKELSKWKPHPAVGHLYKVYLEDLQIQTHKIRQQELILIQQEMNRLKERQNKARELLLSDGLEPDDYKTIKRECEQSISRLEAKLPELTSTVTDIAPMMDNALVLLDELDIAYEKFTTIKKRELIGSIFPEKLQFDGVGYRTTRINEAVQLIYSLGQAFREIEMGQVKSISDLSHQVNPLVHFSNQFLIDLRKLSQLQASINNAA